MESKNQLSISRYPEQTHIAIVKELHERGTTYSYTGLYRTIRDIALKHYVKLGNNKAKMFAKYYYEEAKYIIKKDVGLYLVKPL